jgi:DNA primase
LADIVGDYVTLKNAGVGSMKGLCPFHEERSPSFHVRPQVGFYHCFGCGEGGDVFTFLQKMDHVTFSEAVERLAGRLAYELHYEDGGQATDHGNRARILSANKAAEDFYREQLASSEAELGRVFLGQRGFDQAAAERFGVGYAPRGGALGKHLKTLGYTEEELVTAGLLGRGDRGDVYDRFRGRLVWPIRDVTGQTLGFGARKLRDDDNGPKYLNTPETPVYHKSQVLYGLDLAKRDVARGKQIVVVEGYTDVMACHLAGVTTAVATCGTAFGGDHVKIVRRVLGDFDNADTTATGEVIFTFDPDEAGQKAASRAFSEEQRFAAQTFVAVAPDGLDPCDLRLHKGDDAVRRLVTTRKPMFEFMIRRTLADHDLETVEGRVAALRASAPVVAGIRDQAMGVGYTRNLAGWLGMDPSEVTRAVSAARSSVSKSSGDTTSSRSRGSGSGSSGGAGYRGNGAPQGGNAQTANGRGSGSQYASAQRPGASQPRHSAEQEPVPATGAPPLDRRTSTPGSYATNSSQPANNGYSPSAAPVSEDHYIPNDADAPQHDWAPDDGYPPHDGHVASDGYPPNDALPPRDLDAPGAAQTPAGSRGSGNGGVPARGLAPGAAATLNPGYPSTEIRALASSDWDPEQQLLEATPSIVDLPTDQATRLERDALMAMLQHPTDIGRDMLARATQVGFSNATLAVVRDAIATSLDAMESTDWVATVIREVPPSFASLIQQLAIAPIPQRAEQIAMYCQEITASLVGLDLLRAKADLLGSLQRTDPVADPERYARIQRDLLDVERERRTLRNE